MNGAGRRLRVLPDGERVEEAMLDEAASAGFVDGRGWLSFGQLVEMLEGAQALGRSPCEPLVSRVLLWAEVTKLGPGPFGEFARTPAFARGALDVLFDLKAGAARVEDLARVVAKLPGPRRERAAYLVALFERYETRLAELQLADREDQLRGAVARLDEGLPSRFRDFTELSVSALHDLTPERAELLFALARACGRAGVRFSLEFPGAGQPWVDAAVDGHLGEWERRFRDAPHVDVSKSDLLGMGRVLAPLGKWLFAPGAPLGAAAPLAPHLQRVKVATAKDEAVYLASRAAQWVDEGVPPERIAIVYRDLGPEAEWVAEALAERGIPSRARLGLPLGATGPGRVALGLPEWVDRNFPADAVARLLSCRYLPGLGHFRIDAPARLLALAGIRDDVLGADSGRGAYDVRLTRLFERLEGRGAGRGAEVSRLREAVRTLLAQGRSLPEEGRALELLAAWWKTLETWGLPEALRRPEGTAGPSTSLGRSVLRALARDQAAGEALRGLALSLEDAFRRAGAGGHAMGRALFHRWLGDAAQDFNLVPSGRRNASIRILDARDMSGRRFEHVLLGGVVEGRFPGRPAPHALFPDEDRAQVNRLLGKPVFQLSSGEFEGRTPQRLAEDRLLLFLTLAAAEQSAVVSCARLGPSGAEQTPSAFYDELGQLVGDVPQVIPWRAVPALDEVQCESVLREWVALEALAPRALRSGDPDPARAVVPRMFSQETWFREAERLAQIEVERLRFFSDTRLPPGPFSGEVARPDTLPLLAEALRFDAAHPLSSSSLGRYGRCAFQGFLGHLLRLDAPREVDEEMDAAGEGAFWHGVLERLYPLLQARGLLRTRPDALPDDVVDEALSLAADEARRSLHVGHPALWSLGHEKARRMVRRLWGSEHRGLPFDNHHPVHTELPFGRSGAPDGWREVWLPGPDGSPPIHFEGKIDRIDRAPGSLGIVDYKRRRLDSGTELYEALLTQEFQLPLYLHAARGAGAEGTLQAAWVSMRDGKAIHLGELLKKAGGSVETLLATDEAVRAQLAERGEKNLINAVHTLVRTLRQGHFAARSDDCQHCSYRAVCRVSARSFEEGASDE